MPYYVERDFSGKVVGLCTNPSVQEDGFCLTDPDPLPDDHPEIVAFWKEHPAPQFPMLTREQMEEASRQQEKNQEDVRKLERLMLAHFSHMSSLELALGGLLQQILNIQGNAQNVARAIYPRHISPKSWRIQIQTNRLSNAEIHPLIGARVFRFGLCVSDDQMQRVIARRQCRQSQPPAALKPSIVHCGIHLARRALKDCLAVLVDFNLHHQVGLARRI